MENNEKDLIIADSIDEASLPVTVENDMIALVERAEEQLQAFNKILKLAVSRTNAKDWVNQNGKPYLQSSGAEKVMTLFGVCVKDTKSQKIISQDDLGVFYIYELVGTFFFKNGNSIEARGARSSRDKFFAWDSFNHIYKPASLIKEVDIMKAAYSNLIVNGVTRLLGIRNLTWDILNSLGINKNEVAAIEYKNKFKEEPQHKPIESSVEKPKSESTEENTKSKEETNTTNKENTPKSEIETEDEKHRRELIELLDTKFGKDENIKADTLLKVTEFINKEGVKVSGVTDVFALKGVRLRIARDKIRGLK